MWKLKIMAQIKALWTHQIPIAQRRVMNNVENMCLSEHSMTFHNLSPLSRKPSHLRMILGRVKSELLRVWTKRPGSGRSGRMVCLLLRLPASSPGCRAPCTPRIPHPQSWHLIHTLFSSLFQNKDTTIILFITKAKLCFICPSSFNPQNAGSGRAFPIPH